MSRRLGRRRANPRAGWSIDDVVALCREHGVLCAPPRGGGSHYKVGHRDLPEKLTIPYRWPIKPVYVRKLVDFIDRVRRLA